MVFDYAEYFGERYVLCRSIRVTTPMLSLDISQRLQLEANHPVTIYLNLTKSNLLWFHILLFLRIFLQAKHLYSACDELKVHSNPFEACLFLFHPKSTAQCFETGLEVLCKSYAQKHLLLRKKRKTTLKNVLNPRSTLSTLNLQLSRSIGFGFT